MDETKTQYAIRFMKNFAFVIVLFLPSILLAQEFNFYEKADSFFKKYAKKNGLIDYEAIKNSPEELNLLTNHIQDYNWNETEEKAYLINVYNLSVINKVINNYPVTSPMEVPDFFDANDITLNKEKISLNKIENEILRPKYKDARLHFALVCGAIGCPKILNEAYKSNQVDSQLNQQTKLAINDPTFINSKSGVIYISEIFNWYLSDFGGNKKSIIHFINKYRDIPFSEDLKINYITYNWTLNDLTIKNSSLSEESHETTSLNLQTFTAGSLLGKNKFDFTLFNTIYTETKSNWLGQDFSGFRSTFVTNLIQLTFGVTKSKRLNIGLDLNVRNNGRSADSSISGLKTAFSYSNSDSSRFGLTSVGLRLRAQPFAAVRDFTIQSTFSAPTVRAPEGAFNLFWADWDRYTWWNQFFYTKTWGKFQLFTEFDLWFRFGRNENQIDMLDLPLSLFLSYFPSKQFTFYVMSQHVHRLTNNIQPQNPVINDWVIPMNYTASGIGMKYNINSNFNIELLYTNFWRGTNSGLGSTFNLGLKYVMF